MSDAPDVDPIASEPPPTIGSCIGDLTNRVRGWVQGRPELPPPPQPIDDAASRLARIIAETDPVDRLQSRVRLRDDQAKLLWRFPERLARIAWTEGPESFIRDGLILMAFLDNGVDWRDTMLSLGPFHILLGAKGLSAAEVFEEAAATAPLPEIAHTFRSVGGRTDIVAGKAGWTAFDWMKQAQSSGWVTQ